MLPLACLLAGSGEEPLLGHSGERPLHVSTFTVCTPSPQDLRELELLTQALEKAVRVRKGISKAGGKDKAASIATSANTASAPSSASEETKSSRGVCKTTVPAKGLPKRRLRSVEEQTWVRRGAPASKPGPGLRDQQIAPLAAPQAPKAFTLKENG